MGLVRRESSLIIELRIKILKEGKERRGLYTKFIFLGRCVTHTYERKLGRLPTKSKSVSVLT